MAKRFAWLGIGLLLAAASSAHAETGVATFMLDNDLFYHTDRDYTNGIRIAWTTAPLADTDWAVKAAEMFPFFSRGTEVRKSYALGQDMFTPSDITLKNPPLDDHPYAAYLYGALGLIAKMQSGGRLSRLDQIQLQLGVVGPAALGKEAQTLVHRIIHANLPQGWQTQLRNEPAIELSYQRTWRYTLFEALGFTLDASPHLGGAAGNVYDYLNTGGMLRFGEYLPDDFGPVRVDPGLPGSNFFESKTPVGWYLFAGVDGRAIARNIFLDGNTWVRSRHVDKNNFVGDFQFGAALTLGPARLTYTHVLRSREFKTQHGADQFGAVSVSWRF